MRIHLGAAMAKKMISVIVLNSLATITSCVMIPLFTMLGANTSIAPLTWLEQRRGTTVMTSEIREKALFILDEIDEIIRQAEEQI